jgi:hypothetical protein
MGDRCLVDFFEERSLVVKWIGDRCLVCFLEGRSLGMGMDRRSLVGFVFWVAIALL